MCVSTSMVLIWALQSLQSKIHVAQHWGRRGAEYFWHIVEWSDYQVERSGLEWSVHGTKWRDRSYNTHHKLLKQTLLLVNFLKTFLHSIIALFFSLRWWVYLVPEAKKPKSVPHIEFYTETMELSDYKIEWSGLKRYDHGRNWPETLSCTRSFL